MCVCSLQLGRKVAQYDFCAANLWRSEIGDIFDISHWLKLPLRIVQDDTSLGCRTPFYAEIEPCLPIANHSVTFCAVKVKGKLMV